MDGHDLTCWAASSGAAAHVFVDDLADSVDLDGADGHHLARVRRLRPGESVSASDGVGLWRCYSVVAAAGGHLTLEAFGGICREPSLRPAVSMAVALTKGGIDEVVARLTEIGVARIEPFRARRSVVRWDEARAERAVERLRSVTREASMQCRRARIPEVGTVVDLADLCRRSGLLVGDRGGVPPGEVPLPGNGGTWTVVVGPEGGLDAQEMEALGGALRVGVGPHVLRAETAPVALAAALVARATADG